MYTCIQQSGTVQPVCTGVAKQLSCEAGMVSQPSSLGELGVSAEQTPTFEAYAISSELDRNVSAACDNYNSVKGALSDHCS